MGGLAHYLEDEGIATTQISLVRLHTEKLRPPRALWVPFELGRPLGTPDDAAFQRRVLLSALELLTAESGPVLVDFEEDAPDAQDLEGWVCPINLSLPQQEGATENGLAPAFLDEIAQLSTWYQLAVDRRGRTTVGASEMPIEEIGRFIASFLNGAAPTSPRPDLTLQAALKHATEDLKAYYFEAATAQPGHASSKQIADWFWGGTTAGKVFLKLKAACEANEDRAIQLLGQALMVPRAQAHRLSAP